jgi:hypothetical protein
LVYVDDVNMLGGSIHTIKENAEALILASKEIELEVNAGKTKYWLCIEIRMQDEVTLARLIINPLKEWNISNIRENPKRINILLRKKLRTA